ncbi:MAG: hypothetical protein WCO44_04025 [Bacteroidota bacterium]
MNQAGQRKRPAKRKPHENGVLFEGKSNQKASALLLKISCKVKLMKIFFAKSDRLKAPSPLQVHSDFEGKI